MTPYLLAIDNGSQSTKVTIFDSRGHAVASARRALAALYDGTGPRLTPLGAKEHIPTTPAKMMQAATSGAIDQNMSRPS